MGDTLLKDDIVTPAPKVVADKTSFPAILYVLPVAISKFSLDLSDVEALFQTNVFLFPVEPIPIPAPSSNKSLVAVVPIPI